MVIAARSSSPSSIYAHLGTGSAGPSPAARQARRRRKEARLASLADRCPDLATHLSTDRLSPILDVLRRCREDSRPGAEHAELERHLLGLRAEVEALERWAAARGPREQRSGPVVRQALDFLTTFGRITVLDFSSIPVEEKGRMVAILALEHRWCYAAAGTTRDALKEATGRTGAR